MQTNAISSRRGAISQLAQLTGGVAIAGTGAAAVAAWQAATRALADLPGDAPEAEYEPLVGVTNDLERRILTAQPTSLTGLAVKLRMQLSLAADNWLSEDLARGDPILDEWLTIRA